MLQSIRPPWIAYLILKWVPRLMFLLKYLVSSTQKAYRALQSQQDWSHDPTAATYGFALEESPASETAPEGGVTLEQS